MSRPTLRTVSVLYCDLVDSVGLASRLSEHAYFDQVLEPFYEAAERLIADHGGIMRPVIEGDRIMAVFGVPVEEPDDALRAVEAAVALRARIGELSRKLEDERDVRLQVHTGVNTGTVVVRNPERDPTAAFGDAANVGARLQDAAGPGEILLGERTHQLVSGVVVAEPVPVIVRGKQTPLTGWRLKRVDRAGVRRGPRVAAPLVGRELDLALLHWAYQRVTTESACHVVNVLGLAGVGKSRLVEEFVLSLDETPMILRAHCPAYGPGITYRPIMQLVAQAADVEPDDTAERIHERVLDLVDRHGRTTEKVMRLFGEPGNLIERDEIFRGVQRTFETLARRRPLVFVIEDLHEAKPVSLDAIRRLVGSLRDSRILVVCLARSEFLADGGALGAGSPNVHNLQLYPLPDDKVGQMVSHLLSGGEPPAGLRELVNAWADGNPLYLQELVDFLVAEERLRLRDGRWEMQVDLKQRIEATPKIEAVLGARLSRLADTERPLIHRAAVIGLQFNVAGLMALLPEPLDRDTVTAILERLVEKDLLVLDHTTRVRSGADGRSYKFKHMLIQDTAYRRIDKATRAGLHRRYAEWLDQSRKPSAPLQERIGFHLATAYTDHVEELGREDDQARQLARRAGEFLAAAGHGHVRQGAFPTVAIDVLRRAVELLPEGHEALLQARLDLAEALRDDGAEEEARAAFDAVVEAARQAGDTAIEMHAILGRLELEWFQDSWDTWEQGHQDLERAIWEFVRLGDNLGLAKAHRLSAHGHMSLGESTRAREAAERAIEFVRRTDRVRLEAKILRLHCLILFWGPTPLEEVVRRNEEVLEWARAHDISSLEARALETLARTAALRGDFSEARRLSKEARNLIPDLGELLTNASDSISEGLIELLAGDLDAAERALRGGYEALVQRGARGPLANVAALLARVLLLKQQDDEAEELALICRESAAESQLDTQIKWRSLLAVIEARRGDHAVAERLAREAVVLAGGSEQPASRAEALVDLAEVLHRAGKDEEARGYTAQALQLYELKGDLVAAAKARANLAI